MIIKAAILVFISFVVWRIARRFRANDITGRELTLWLVFWLLVAVATVVPRRTDVIAQAVGVERGADLLIYLSVIVIFAVLFRLLVRQQKIERDITTIVREVGLRQADKDQHRD